METTEIIESKILVDEHGKPLVTESPKPLKRVTFTVYETLGLQLDLTEDK